MLRVQVCLSFAWCTSTRPLHRVCCARSRMFVMMKPFPAMTQRCVAVVGGGISGLTAAWHVSRLLPSARAYSAWSVPAQRLQVLFCLRPRLGSAETSACVHRGSHHQLIMSAVC